MKKVKVKPPFVIDEEVVGDVVDHTLRIHVDKSEWVCRDQRGWSLDIRVLEEADRRNIKSVDLINLVGGLLYQAPLSDFRRVGIRADQGRHQRKCLPIGYWEVTRMLV